MSERAKLIATMAATIASGLVVRGRFPVSYHALLEREAVNIADGILRAAERKAEEGSDR